MYKAIKFTGNVENSVVDQFNAWCEENKNRIRVINITHQTMANGVECLCALVYFRKPR